MTDVKEQKSDSRPDKWIRRIFALCILIGVSWLGTLGWLHLTGALQKAVKAGERGRVALLLGIGVNVNDLSVRRGVPSTPLSAAVGGGNEEMVEFLIDRGADPNRYAFSTQSDPLRVAATQGNGQMVELLIANGADPDQSDRKGVKSPVMLAIMYQHMDVALQLVQARKQLDMTDREGPYVFRAALSADHRALVTECVQRTVDRFPLFSFGSLEYFSDSVFSVEWLVSALLDAGSDATLSKSLKDDDFYTALVLLVLDGHYRDGGGPLHMAASSGNVEALEGFYARHASMIHEYDSRGATPLHRAIERERVQSVRFLLDRGADPDQPMAIGWSPLYLCLRSFPQNDIHHPRRKIFVQLLAAGADPNGIESGRETPLHMAATRDLTDAITLLLEFGADPKATNYLGKTPIEMAVHQGRREAAEVFRAHARASR